MKVMGRSCLVIAALWNLSIQPVISQDCPVTTCAEQGLVPVATPHRPVSNGCSVPSFIQLPDFTFEKCCDHHDACYQSCGVKKGDCEVHFDRCLKKHCKSAYPGNQECLGTASTFVTGVRMFGCNGFQNSQDSGCQCVEKTEVASANEQVLKAFYSQYNTSKTAEDIRAALLKNEGKEGKMWHALYNKYPSSIEIISRDGQAQAASGRGSEL